MRRLLLVVAALPACGLGKAYPRTEICADAASAVGARVEVCKDDLAQARAAEDAFTAEVTCDTSATELESVRLYECLGAIDAMKCTQVDAFGDDWGRWLEVSPLCDEFLWADSADGGDSGR